MSLGTPKLSGLAIGTSAVTILSELLHPLTTHSCHRRKVKCISDSTDSCKNCVAASLACTYNAIPQKKGPKGNRAKVLSELRENQRNAQIAASFPTELGFDGRIQSSPFARTHGILPVELVQSSLNYYFDYVYPSEPILHRQVAQQTVVNMEHSSEAYCMITALCAYVLIKANMAVSPILLERREMAQMSNVSRGQALLQESVRVQGNCDHRENPTYLVVLTSWFCCGSYLGLAKENTSWTYLRDATTQVQLLGMHDENAYKDNVLDVFQKRALFWVLFIAERYTTRYSLNLVSLNSLTYRTSALRKHRSITLHSTLFLPCASEPSDEPVAIALGHLINLYKVVDDTFIGLWNRLHTQASPAWITQLYTQLAAAAPPYFAGTEVQAVEIRVCEHWLKTMVWQLCLSHGLISNASSEDCMTYKYPICVANGLFDSIQYYCLQNTGIHGPELVSNMNLGPSLLPFYTRRSIDDSQFDPISVPNLLRRT
jgi:hypothetical protein